jgi:hypothetical protein
MFLVGSCNGLLGPETHPRTTSRPGSPWTTPFGSTAAWPLLAGLHRASKEQIGLDTLARGFALRGLIVLVETGVGYSHMSAILDLLCGIGWSGEGLHPRPATQGMQDAPAKPHPDVQ